MLTYFMEILSIWHPFDIIYGHLQYFVVIFGLFSPGILYQEKSGNPVVGDVILLFF
jgi:hypothetical protein